MFVVALLEQLYIATSGKRRCFNGSSSKLPLQAADAYACAPCLALLAIILMHNV